MGRGGSSRLGQIPNFYRKFVLGASLRLIFQTHVMEWCFIIDIFFSSYSFRWKTPCLIQTTMSEYKKIQLTPQRDEASKRQSEIDYRPIYGTILSWYKWYIGEDSKVTTNRRPGLLCDYWTASRQLSMAMIVENRFDHLSVYNSTREVLDENVGIVDNFAC